MRIGTEELTIPCKFCGAPTHMTGTKMCDNCYELRVRLMDVPLEALGAIAEEVGLLDRMARYLEQREKGATP